MALQKLRGASALRGSGRGLQDETRTKTVPDIYNQRTDPVWIATVWIANLSVRLASALLSGRKVPAKPNLLMPNFIRGATLANLRRS